MTVHIPEPLRADVETLWSYHDLGQPLRPTDVGIGLGSHDIGVADYTAELYHRGLFPLLVFTGANSSATPSASPRTRRLVSPLRNMYPPRWRPRTSVWWRPATTHV